MTDWTKVLTTIAPRGRPAIIAGMAAAMPEVIEHAGLGTLARCALFLAEVGEESDGFRAVEEYASGREYEGRKDLGNTHAGDGLRYKGRSPIMLTGRANYEIYGERLKADLVNQPDLAATFPLAGMIAAEFWRTHNLNRFADHSDISGATEIINGGENGLSERRIYLARAKSVLTSLKVFP